MRGHRSATPPLRNRALTPPSIRRTGDRSAGFQGPSGDRDVEASLSLSRRLASDSSRTAERRGPVSQPSHRSGRSLSPPPRKDPPPSRRLEVSDLGRREVSPPMPRKEIYPPIRTPDASSLHPKRARGSPPLSTRLGNADSPSLLSRLGPTDKLQDRIMRRHGENGDGPPLKRSRLEDDEHERSRVRLDTSEPGSARTRGDRHVGRPRSLSPRRQRSPIRIFGASRNRENAADNKRSDAVNTNVEEGPVAYVDIAKLPGVVLDDTATVGKALIRLYNPDTGSSTDARAVLESIKSSAPVKSSTDPNSSVSSGQILPEAERSPRASTPLATEAKPVLSFDSARLPPLRAIPGLPAKPVVTESTFEALRDRYKPGSPIPSGSGLERERLGADRSSRETSRPKPRNDNRSIDIDSYRPLRPTGRSRSRSPQPKPTVMLS